MRTVQTFILRLLVDTDHPQALHGTVQAVADGEARPFASLEALLTLLRRMGQDTDRPILDKTVEEER